MDGAKEKKNLITKTWERCKSLSGGSTKSSKHAFAFSKKSRSWRPTASAASCMTAAAEEEEQRRVAPEGCFSVYVGPERQRFIVKAKCANHPLFVALLEEAESEFGYNKDGPIVLPCSVVVFWKVLAEMDGEDEFQRGCGFVRSRSYHLLSPQSKMVSMNQF